MAHNSPPTVLSAGKYWLCCMYEYTGAEMNVDLEVYTVELTLDLDTWWHGNTFYSTGSLWGETTSNCWISVRYLMYPMLSPELAVEVTGGLRWFNAHMTSTWCNLEKHTEYLVLLKQGLESSLWFIMFVFLSLHCFYMQLDIYAHAVLRVVFKYLNTANIFSIKC